MPDAHVVLPATGALIRLAPPPAMSAEDFRATLRELRLNQTELGTFVGVGKDGVSKWSRGHRPIPSAVAAWLHLARAAQACGVSFEKSPGPWGNVRRARAAAARADPGKMALAL